MPNIPIFLFAFAELWAKLVQACVLPLPKLDTSASNFETSPFSLEFCSVLRDRRVRFAPVVVPMWSVVVVSEPVLVLFEPIVVPFESV